MNRRTFQLDGEPQGGGNPNPPIQATPTARDLAGYPNEDALVQGYRNSSREAQNWRERALALEAQLAANPRQDVPQRGPASPYDRMSEYGIPVDAFREAIQTEIQQAFQPIARGLTARSRVLGEYPDYTKFEADVSQFINSDPNLAATYNNMFNADPVGAMEYAFLKFGETRRRTAPAETAKNGDKQSASHASIPSSRAPESRQAPGQGEDMTSKAWEHFQKTGDSRPFAKTRLRQVIPDSFFEK